MAPKTEPIMPENLSAKELQTVEWILEQIGLPPFHTWRHDWILNHDEVTWKPEAKDARWDVYAGGEYGFLV